jgi:hypothetical protein
MLAAPLVAPNIVNVYSSIANVLEAANEGAARTTECHEWLETHSSFVLFPSVDARCCIRVDSIQ